MAPSNSPSDQQLSPHFWLSELTVSDAAERAGLANEPTPWHVRNLTRVAEVLECVRMQLGDKPITVRSGYRSRAVNSLVKGAKDSAHMRGLAADVIAPGFGTPREIALRIARSDLMADIDQLIYEGTWVHIGLAERGQPARQQLLTARFVKGCPTTYLPGIV